MALLAQVHVNFRPLDGTWDGKHWDRQGARCSNDFLAGPNPPLPPAGVTALRWDIDSPEADSIVFDVSVDRPGDDDVIFPGVRNGVETTYLPTPAVDAYGRDGSPWYKGQPWGEYYRRGIYIASVSGATAPFFININGVSAESQPTEGPIHTVEGEPVRSAGHGAGHRD